jgi:hypothetical protein
MSSDVSIEDKNFSTRDFAYLHLPIDEKFEIKHPDRVILKFGDTTFDVGALCYSKRSGENRVASQSRLVDLDSFDPARTIVIVRLIRLTSLLLVGLRPITVCAMLDEFRMFADFCDEHELIDILDCGESSEKAFAFFANHIYERFRQDIIGATRGQSIQTHVLKLLKALSGNKGFGSEVRLISLKGKRVREDTLPASQSDFSHLLAMSQLIFNGLSDLILNNSPFPLKLELPGSLNWSTGNHLWVFPTHVWCLPPRFWGKERGKLYRPGWAYGYENGLLNSVEEIWSNFGGDGEVAKRHRAEYSLKCAKKLLESANSDPAHFRRLHFAKLAFNSFMLLFFANTGVNPSVLTELETEEEIDASIVNQSYRAIKYRAHGKVVTVRVPVSFMPDLRKFMALRKFILNGIKYSLLFFRFNRFYHSLETIKPLTVELH